MKTKITITDIHNAVNDLISEEKQPTLVAIRQKVGGGSYTTISEAMKSYKANKDEQQPPKEDAPASVLASASQLAIAVWDIANNLATQKILHEREALEKTRRECGQQQAQAIELADSLANELDEAREVIEQQKAELSKAQAQQAELQLMASKVEAQQAELLAIKQMLAELMASKVEP